MEMLPATWLLLYTLVTLNIDAQGRDSYRPMSEPATSWSDCQGKKAALLRMQTPKRRFEGARCEGRDAVRLPPTTTGTIEHE